MPWKDPEMGRIYDRKRRKLPHRIEAKRRWNKLPHVKERRKHSFRFMSRTIYLSWIPLLTGKCSNCHKDNLKTERHHSKGYFIIFPWFGIVELCKGCHDKTKNNFAGYYIRRPEIKEKYRLNAMKQNQQRDPLTGRFIRNHQ